MQLKTLNTQLQTLLVEASTLQAAMDAKSENGKTAYDGLSADRERLIKMSQDVEALQMQIKAAQALENAKGFAGVPGEVVVQGKESWEPAGSTTIERRKDGGIDVLDEGAGGLDPKTRAAISSKAYKQAFRKYLCDPLGVKGLYTPSDMKTMQEGVDSQGGFFVPEDMLNRVIEKAPAPTQLAGLVTNITTGRDAITIPQNVYTSDNKYTTPVRVTWTGEIPASSTAHRATDPTLGQARIPVHTAMLSLAITNDMIEDSAFPLLSWLSGKFNETADLLKEDMILNGSSIGQPEGLLTKAGATGGIDAVVSGSNAALTADGLIDLDYAIPPQYLRNLRWVMSRVNTAKAIAKLKDSSNQYLFKMGGSYLANGGLQGEFPDTLNGKPIVYSEFMPSPAANAFPIIFGDLSGYYLVNRVGFSVQVLREVYAELNQVVLLGRLRIGGQPVETWKMKAQKCST